jgi:restriction system protein
MPIPDFQTVMLPLLRLMEDGEPHENKEILATLADQFNLTEEEREQLLPSGGTRVFTNRVAWAKSHLKGAQLVESSKRGVYNIAKRGIEVLSRKLDRIDLRVLSEFPEYQAFRKPKQANKIEPNVTGTDPTQDTQTPEEHIEYGHSRLRRELAESLIESMKAASPAFFERLVLELLLAMGYGGSRNDAGSTLGRSGDGGVDGVIKEDRLGLEVIYIQAKRWDGTVGRPEIQKFAGALQGQRARKGVFITTSDFSREAEDYAATIETRIVLINGETLAGLMIDQDIGVTPLTTYEVKRIDTDYFEQD